jgi:hypothetical protein
MYYLQILLMPIKKTKTLFKLIGGDREDGLS